MRFAVLLLTSDTLCEILSKNGPQIIAEFSAISPISSVYCQIRDASAILSCFTRKVKLQLVFCLISVLKYPHCNEKILQERPASESGNCAGYTG